MSIVLQSTGGGQITLLEPTTASNFTQTLPAATGTVALTNAPVFTGQATIPTINLTGGQITFPATQSASSDANTLDDYEEGTFTPNLFDGSNNVSMGTCTYTKVGNVVTIHANAYGLNVTSLGVNSALTITGLPFAKQTNFNFFQLLIGQFVSNTNTVTCGDGSSTTTNLYTPNSAQDYDFFTRNRWGGASSITLRFTMTYRTT